MTHKITSFIIAETEPRPDVPQQGEPTAVISGKSAPHYFAKTVPSQLIVGAEKVSIAGREIEIIAKTYGPDTILVEGTLEVPDIFAEDVWSVKDKLKETCYDFARRQNAKDEPAEEYTLYQVSGYHGDPGKIVTQKATRIVGLLKSEKLELDPKEIEYSLSFQFKYGKGDLVIVDWDGAFAFDQEGEFGETLELLELANYQLLRYRILDIQLDDKIKTVSKLSMADKRHWRLWRSSDISAEFRGLIKTRSQAIAQFEALERDIKLIGDWYSARLYDLLSKKFRLDGWRQAVREKMDSLRDIYTIASENLGMSRHQRLELIQIWAFFVLQIGWFLLIILEFFYFSSQ